jgi:hypothetical protein
VDAQLVTEENERMLPLQDLLLRHPRTLITQMA